MDTELMEELEIKSMTVDRTSRLSETLIYLLLCPPSLPPALWNFLWFWLKLYWAGQSTGLVTVPALTKCEKKEKSGKKVVDFTLSAGGQQCELNLEHQKGKSLGFFESTLDILLPSRSTRFEQILFFPFLMVLCSQPQSPSNYLSWSSPESMSPNKIRAEQKSWLISGHILFWIYNRHKHMAAIFLKHK